MQVWMNGSFRDLDEASIPVTDRGFLLGDGFFETMRAHEGKIAWIDAGDTIHPCPRIRPGRLRR